VVVAVYKEDGSSWSFFFPSLFSFFIPSESFFCTVIWSTYIGPGGVPCFLPFLLFLEIVKNIYV
jgi:hypothetical protein